MTPAVRISFRRATFGGRFSGNNTVNTVQSPEVYPSAWNVTYLNPEQVFLYGGGSGDDTSSIGAYAARIDPNTLQPIWYDQLINTSDNGEWDYPGAQAILDNGKLYVIYGYHLSKIDPSTGDVLATLTLPTGDAAPADTTYNGFSATSDGTIVAKAFYRQAGCTIQGPNALAECPDPSDVPNSVLVTVNPATMKITDQTTMAADVIGRVTIGRHKGREYAYFFVVDTCVRYEVRKGRLKLDSTWNPGTLLTSGQTPGWALVVLHDWVVGQSNGLPASAPLSVFAVNQGDASKQSMLQPFAGDPIPPLVEAAFSKTGSRWHTGSQLECSNGLGRSEIESDLRHGRAAGRDRSGASRLGWTDDRMEGGANDHRVHRDHRATQAASHRRLGHSRRPDSGRKHRGRGGVAECSDGSGDRPVGAVTGDDVWHDGPAVLLWRDVLSGRGGIAVQAPADSRLL